MHILIAPNAFKNSLSAYEAAIAIQQGLNLSLLECTTECFPIADGGDGTGSLIIQKCKGITIETQVHDAMGKEITASFGLINNGNTAVIEMADASGLRLLPVDKLDPLKASSVGTGELIKAALDKNVTRIIIAMGGSATVDGGCGILHALGMKFFDSENQVLNPYPESLMNISRFDLSQTDERLHKCEIIVLCDVNNKLLGKKGSAAVFGPQKGATPNAVIELDGFLTQLNNVAKHQRGKDMNMLKYGGTAGGAAAGLSMFLNARLENGADYFLDILGFDEALKKADVLITGEGSIDSQTLHGKAPFNAAYRAKKINILTIGIGGKVPLRPEPGLTNLFDIILAIGNEPADLSTALKNTPTNLTRLATSIGNLLSYR